MRDGQERNIPSWDPEPASLAQDTSAKHLITAGRGEKCIAYLVEVLKQIQNPPSDFILAEAGGGGVAPHGGDDIHGWSSSRAHGEEGGSLDSSSYRRSRPGLRNGGPGEAEEGGPIHFISLICYTSVGRG